MKYDPVHKTETVAPLTVTCDHCPHEFTTGDTIHVIHILRKRRDVCDACAQMILAFIDNVV